MSENFKESLLITNASMSQFIRDIIARLQNLDVNINSSSRLYRYAKLFDPNEKFNSFNSLDMTNDFALLESLQFSAIVSALEGMEERSPWLLKAGSATTGAVLATGDNLDTRARSDQFELFLMACLAKAGFKVDAAEPDLITHVGQQRLAIAAKRLRSSAKLERNLKDGAKQIARKELHGIVAVDLSFIELINKPIFIENSEYQLLPAKILLDGFACENLSLISRIYQRHVSGVLLHLSCAARCIRPAALFVSRRWILMSEQLDPVCGRLLAGLQQLRP